LLETIGAAFVVAAADYAYNRWNLSQEMKMTLKELKEEMRQEDGDPKLKAKMRAKARALAKKRMMTDVKTASVVVANPTHVSVALRYRNDDPAPIVVAKGHDEVALAIRTKAREHGIPIVENRPLARTLDAEISVGHPVKVEHFAAVAKVLAFVHRLKRRGR
jgi:flagellar biosynthetic protein FlhB